MCYIAFNPDNGPEYRQTDLRPMASGFRAFLYLNIYILYFTKRSKSSSVMPSRMEPFSRVKPSASARRSRSSISSVE